MPEQLNERERWLIEVATAYAWGCGGAMEPLPTTKELIDKIMRRSVDCPPDPRDAELSALRAEVARLKEEGLMLRRVDDLARASEKRAVGECRRLNGLLDEVGEICGVQSNFPFRGHLLDILSRRTAERKEPTDASD